MASWREFETAAPGLAEAVRALFEAQRHKTLATLRRDGAPRISAIEAIFVAGELWFGGWADSLKVRDLRRDPRFALHSGTADPVYEGATPTSWAGDAKVAGRAVEVTDPEMLSVATDGASANWPPGVHAVFRADLNEVVLTRTGDPPDHLLIESWRGGQGVRRVERR